VNRYRVEVELDVWASDEQAARERVEELYCPPGEMTGALIYSTSTGRPLLEFDAIDGGSWDTVDDHTGNGRRQLTMEIVG
jgi:hypothetical protein